MEITNERTGETWNYSRKHEDVLFQGIFAPKGAPEWMRDRSQLWNSIEKAERQHNSQVARDFIIALPHELDLTQQRYLMQDWIKENFTRKGFVADLAIHQPGQEGDIRNVHAHVLVTMRTISGQDWNTQKVRSADRLADLDQWRDSWEKLGNKRLLQNGYEATLDKRTLAEQGIDRVPTIHLGKGASEMERAGMETSRGDLLREIQTENLAKDLERKFEHSVTVQELHRQPVAIEEPESGSRSAIDRQRDEEREAGRREGFQRDHAQRGVMAAIWRLARTAGANLSHIILGVDRADHLRMRPAGPQRLSREQLAAQKEREAFAAELRGEAPAVEQPKEPLQAAPTRQVNEAAPLRPNQRLDAYLEAQELLAMTKTLEANAQEITERKAAAVFEKYNAPAQSAEVKNEVAAEPAAWAPARHDLGRVQGLIDALGVTPHPPAQQQRESYLDRLEREQKEKGQTLADLLPQQERDRQRQQEQDNGLDLGL